MVIYNNFRKWFQEGITGGNMHDCTQAESLLSSTVHKGVNVLADKAYDADKIIKYITTKSIANSLGNAIKKFIDILNYQIKIVMKEDNYKGSLSMLELRKLLYLRWEDELAFFQAIFC